MERFASSPAALQSWATHHRTAAPIPLEAAKAIARAASGDRFGGAIRLQMDAVSAMLDLRLHAAPMAPTAAETTVGSIYCYVLSSGRHGFPLRLQMDAVSAMLDLRLHTAPTAPTATATTVGSIYC